MFTQAFISPGAGSAEENSADLTLVTTVLLLIVSAVLMGTLQILTKCVCVVKLAELAHGDSSLKQASQQRVMSRGRQQRDERRVVKSKPRALTKPTCLLPNLSATDQQKQTARLHIIRVEH